MPETTIHSQLNPQQMLALCLSGTDIPYDAMLHLMRLIMRGEVASELLAALLIALRLKEETVDEITAAAHVMRELCVPVQVQKTANFIDIVGTGGDGSHTFNISTCAMFVAAAAGATVAKHGGRSVSSNSGSADVLEALGVNIQLNSEQVAQCIEATGMGFMFAPNHHPAMKRVAPIRKILGTRTIFNILGPLTNPANAPNILMGVFNADLVTIQARVLRRLGAQHAMVVYGKDGMDELSLGAATKVAELKNDIITEYELHPEDFGLSMASNRQLRVDNCEQSKTMLLDVLNNQPGPALDIVLFNAGVALYTANTVNTIEQGIAAARQAIASGTALNKCQAMANFTQQFTH
ncbi:MAG: anthranilate phosphoribosyltransferase [Pseudomonadota bacterium]|jgi:anthranilate phosphoribosyltransferase